MSNGAITGFNIGGILSRGIQVLRRNSASFGMLSALFLLPPFFIRLMLGKNDPMQFLQPSAATHSLYLLEMLLYFLLFATLTHGTISDLRGSPAPIRESLSWSLGRLFPVIGITIVASVCAFFGLMLFIVPGLLLITIWWVAVPATVIERTGILDSLRRSADLTRGDRWRVFGVIIVVYISQLVMVLLTNILFSSAPYFSLFVGLVVTLAFTAYIAVVTAVCYHDLRVLKDGVSIDDIAKVFD